MEEVQHSFSTEENLPAIKLSKPTLGVWSSLLLIAILCVGAFFRFSGLKWDEYSYMHPDERFLLMVAASLTPTQSFDVYFNTTLSPLNPHNQGYTFYVYGTFPLFLARYAAEGVFKQGGLQEVADVGRFLSALFDTLVILLVFLIAKRAYNTKVGLLAAAFYAVAVLPIQLSHFFKEDTFLNFFTSLTAYFAICILVGHDANQGEERQVSDYADGEIIPSASIKLPSVWLFVGFGVALGLALASKLNAAPIVILLPAALFLRYPASLRNQLWVKAGLYLLLAGLICFITFRVFQPYAFSGPGFFGLTPNPEWVADIQEQRAQATGDVDFPPAMQWARRSWWFSGQNLFVWGLGLPLGMLALGSFLMMGWYIGRKWLKLLCHPEQQLSHLSLPSSNRLDIQSSWKQSSLLWGWTAAYFIWQSLSFNPTMRYQLPVYPMFVILAAFGVFALWERGRAKSSRVYVGVSIAVGVLVLASTAIYASAFWSVHNTPFTRVDASRWIYQNILGPINLRIKTPSGMSNQPLAYPSGTLLTPASPFIIPFTPKETGSLKEIIIHRVRDMDGTAGEKTFKLYLSDQPEYLTSPHSAVLRADFLEKPKGDLDGYILTLNEPLSLEKDKTYFLVLTVEGMRCALTFAGENIANEGDWDDSLPLRLDGYDGFGGIYPGDVTFQMYWEDNPDKLTRFLDILNRSDYIVITSNRQWGSLTRIPERFPLVTTFYRHLMGCPPTYSVEKCYRDLQLGRGDLGFELVKVFQSNPRLGNLQINDQYAEEAFTVYDHPKVMIFKKMAGDSSTQRQRILSSVDLAHVLHITPKQAKTRPMNLLLPNDRLMEQRNGGTWSELFDMQSLINRYDVCSVLLWYVSLLLLGILVYPLTHFVFGGLSDKGYPLSRFMGLLLWAWVVWFGSSYRIPFGREWITAALLLIAFLSFIAAYFQIDNLKQEWQTHKKYYLSIELLAFCAFLLVLLIRWGNPDLWHPWKGGEKPMDFSYFNAVIKSTSFPPYDAWFAGGYINYYYYGYVLAALPVKLLGIMPSIGFNLTLATIFSCIVTGAFSLAWNLQARFKWFSGLAAGLAVALLGNLGTWRMILRGLQTIAVPNGDLEAASKGLFSFISLWGYALQGLVNSLAGASLPYSTADWYWIPSRVIAAQGDVEPITEFPFFTVLYADLHAHLFAIPITLLALGWILSFVLGYKSQFTERKGRALWLGATIFIGAMIIGALRPTNTWDFPSYLLLGSLGIVLPVYTLKSTKYTRQGRRKGICAIEQSLFYLLVPAFILLVFLLYLPFSQWFGQGYNALDVWQGSHTTLADYITHWGVFLFFILSWLVYESIDWMASTPLSHIRKLFPYRYLLQGVGILSLCLMLLLGVKLQPSVQLPLNLGILIFPGIAVAWLAIPFFLWSAALFLRPNQPIEKRFLLAIFSLGLLLTLFVEMFTLQGDIGRMNTVFKFYLQTWTFFGISAAASLGWLLPLFTTQNENQRVPAWTAFWQVAAVLLVAAAALYPLTAAPAKIQDRMTPDAPQTLNGMSYMPFASYNDQGIEMYLEQDYAAILWMLENVKGSPVIVEGNTPEYRWGSRFTIYTGLPGVVGWNWHQRQQRGFVSNEMVTERVADIAMFYQTTNTEEAVRFLERYQVKYIVLGQLERLYYPGVGLDKFALMDGVLWREVFREQDTIIYEVSLN